jgi:hypothetical protein
MNRGDHEWVLFRQAMNLPDGVEPYDLSQPFDAQKLIDGFAEESSLVRAQDDPTLSRMTEVAL